MDVSVGDMSDWMRRIGIDPSKRARLGHRGVRVASEIVTCEGK
jgi:hypothetical protein